MNNYVYTIANAKQECSNCGEWIEEEAFCLATEDGEQHFCSVDCLNDYQEDR